MNCHANSYVYFEYALWIVCAWLLVLWRSDKYQVRLCVVKYKLSYEEYDEMDWELINLHPGVSAPAHS